MKKFILTAIVLLLSSFLFVSCSKRKQTLHIYNWSEYVDPTLINRFERDYNCKIVMDYFDSNEAMYAKLKIGNPGYDLIVPSSYMASMMYKENMLMKIDKSKIPNVEYVDLEYPKKTEDPNMEYSVPYAVSFTGLGYNKNKTPDLKPTWGVFGDRQFHHKISMFNDMRETIGAGLKYLGYSINTTDDKQLAEVKDLLIKWKQNLAAYQNEESKTSLADGILLVIQIYNGNIIQMQTDLPEMAFVIPEEGTSIGLDVLVIPAGSKNQELAYNFINFLYDPTNCALNMSYIAYLCPNTKALSLLDNYFLKEISIPEKLLKKSEIIRDLGPANDKYVKIWNEIKTH